MKKHLSKFLLALTCLSPHALADIQCEITEINAWDFGFVLNQIRVENTGDDTVQNWTVYLHFDRTIQITNAWGGRYDKNESNIFKVTPMDYNMNLLAYDSVYFGLQGELSSRLTTDNIKCLSEKEHQAFLEAQAKAAKDDS